MKAISAILLILSTGLLAVAQETAAGTNGKPKTAKEVLNPALSGSGKKHYVPLWLTASKLGSSKIFQTGGNVGIGTSAPTATLDVNGAVNAATSFNLGTNPFAFGSYSNANAFLGFAGNATMTGWSNTASGYQALAANTTGDLNTASGNAALYSNTTGNWNTASGYEALYSNTTGNYNTASGANALFSNTTADFNTASGVSALYYNTTGNYNTASGLNALAYNTTGNYNTASGLAALYYNTTGNYNTALGTLAGPDSNSRGLTNATAIGAYAVVSESNALILGGTGSYAVKVGIGTATPANVFTIAQGAGQAIADGWTTYSSRRWKTNIQTLHGALEKVEQLRGVSYDLKESGKHEVGVIAEEVGAVVPEVVTWEKNGKDAQSVDYSRLTALLIEATKEQQALIHKQQEQIKAQQKQIKAQQMQIQAERTRTDARFAQLASQVKAIQASVPTNGGNGGEVRRVKTQANLMPTGAVQ